MGKTISYKRPDGQSVSWITTMPRAPPAWS
jgi:hypothetical protein